MCHDGGQEHILLTHAYCMIPALADLVPSCLEITLSQSNKEAISILRPRAIFPTSSSSARYSSEPNEQNAVHVRARPRTASRATPFHGLVPRRRSAVAAARVHALFVTGTDTRARSPNIQHPEPPSKQSCQIPSRPYDDEIAHVTVL